MMRVRCPWRTISLSRLDNVVRDVRLSLQVLPVVDEDEDDEANEGWFSGIANKLRFNRNGDDEEDLQRKGERLASQTGKQLKKKRDEYSDGFEDKASRFAKKGKKLAGDGADRLKDQRKKLVGSDDGWFGGLSKKLRGKKDFGDHVDDAIDGLKERGQDAAEYVSERAKQKKRQYSDDLDDKASRFAKKGKKASRNGAKQLKRHRKQFTE